ncbi:MAG: D-alanine-D-alanine ligase [Candidatus Cloacimonadota bacterium]|jgi:D-alanine-D-alanine ligase|nr:D-alanine-D-alanine ligase [Candidatus Cloacimonadota bacterium]
MRKNNKIVILAGGNSTEREVSLESSAQIAKNLSHYETFMLDPGVFVDYCHLIKEIKRIDPLIVFNGLHGAEGEDGRLQALFELENIPFTGSGFRASCIAMDKIVSHKLAAQIGLKIPNYVILGKNDKQDLGKISLPMVVKPNNSGSSVGITIVQSEIELEKAIQNAFQYSEKIICEKYIAGRELTVTVLDDTALPVVEIKPKNGWYDFNNKYTHGNTIYQVPAKLNTAESARIQEQALAIYELMECRSYARVDFRYDGKEFYFLEVNTLPGMTELSLTPMAAAEAGYNFEELLEKIIATSLK